MAPRDCNGFAGRADWREIFAAALPGVKRCTLKREYELRYNNRDLDDGDRTAAAIKASEGNRLTRREPRQQA